MHTERYIELCSYQPGEIILAAGEVPQEVLLIRKGKVDCSANYLPSKSLQPGEFVGLSSYLTGRILQHEYRASRHNLDAVELEVVHDDLLSSDTDMALAACSALAGRLNWCTSLYARSQRPADRNAVPYAPFCPRDSESFDLVLDYLAEQSELELFEGDVLMREGDEANALYVMLEGELLVERAGVEILYRNVPGQMIGEVAVLNGDIRSATVTATRHTRVSVVRQQELAKLFDQSRHFKAYFMRELAWKVYGAQRELVGCTTVAA